MASEMKRDVSPSGIRLYEKGFRLSWGSIFAGTFAAITVMLVMGLLGMAFGVNPAVSGTVGIGVGIWLFISTIAALFVGGWITAFASGGVRQMGAAIHGFVTWCFFTVVTFFIIGSTAIGSLVSGAANIIGRGIITAQGGAPEAFEGVVEMLPSAGFWGFLALVLGGVAAVLGGMYGVSGRSLEMRGAAGMEEVEKREREEEEADRFKRAG